VGLPDVGRLAQHPRTENESTTDSPELDMAGGGKGGGRGGQDQAQHWQQVTRSLGSAVR